MQRTSVSVHLREIPAASHCTGTSFVTLPRPRQGRETGAPHPSKQARAWMTAHGQEQCLRGTKRIEAAESFALHNGKFRVQATEQRRIFPYRFRLLSCITCRCSPSFASQLPRRIVATSSHRRCRCCWLFVGVPRPPLVHKHVVLFAFLRFDIGMVPKLVLEARDGVDAGRSPELGQDHACRCDCGMSPRALLLHCRCACHCCCRYRQPRCEVLVGVVMKMLFVVAAAGRSDS
jgi:hypothetical protein